MKSDVIIIGGGAAGSFAAITAARMGRTVTLFEKNEKIADMIKSTLLNAYFAKIS